MVEEYLCPRCSFRVPREEKAHAHEFKYFKGDEIVGLKADLVYKLDRARELFGAPMVITSGYRDPDKNLAVGGVKNSSHTRGLAVDIKCNDPFMQAKLAWALGCAGFRRVGVYAGHLHCDVDHTLPVPSFFEGEYKT